MFCKKTLLQNHIYAQSDQKMETNTVDCGICFADKVVGICENCECKLCETCFRNHTRAKMFSTHIIFPIEEGINKQNITSNFQTSISTDTGLKSSVDTDIHKQKCKDHTDENQSFYCEKHDICICGRCVISNHTSCLDSVVDLNNIPHNAKDVHRSVSLLQELNEEIDRIMAKIDENRRVNDTCRSSSAKEIHEFHAALVDQLNILMTKAEKESDDLHKQNTDILDEAELKCKEHKQVLLKQMELLDELDHKKCYRHLYLALKRNGKNMELLKEKNARCRHESNIKEYEFVRNLNLVEDFREDKQMGTFTIACDGSEEVIEDFDEIPVKNDDKAPRGKFAMQTPQQSKYSELRPQDMPIRRANSQPSYSNLSSQRRSRFNSPSSPMCMPTANVGMYPQQGTFIQSNAGPFQMYKPMPRPRYSGSISTNQSSIYPEPPQTMPYQAHNPAVYFSQPQNTNRPPNTKRLDVTNRYGSASSTPTTGQPTPQISERLHKLIVEKRLNNEAVIDWIQSNVEEHTTKSKKFIRVLMTAVCTSAIKGEKGNEKLELRILDSRSDLLEKYLDHQPESELQALYALQVLITRLEHPHGLLHGMFEILYDNDFISEDAFLQWEKSGEEPEGKETALKQLGNFFKWIHAKS